MKIVWAALYFAVIGILSNIIGEMLPRKWFHWDKKPFSSFAFEKNGDIYDKIRIKKWKNKVPDMSKLLKKMVPKKVSFRDSSASIDRLLRETCVAETVHAVLCILGLAIFFLSTSVWFIIVYILYLFGNIPFIMIQRYNRPHLARLHARMVQREKTQNKETDISQQ